jgi:GNAT superfamily N-acetyltransferase
MDTKSQIEIRLLAETDIAAAMRLTELERWNQTERDWHRLLKLGPDGCFAAWLDGRLVGTVTTTTYGRELAWIGMVLVAPEYRRHGIATQLMSAGIDYLRSAGIATVKLDATPSGRPIYEALGFVSEGLIERWETVAPIRPLKGCRSLDAAMRRQMYELDRRAFGANRASLLDLLIADSWVAPLAVTTSDGQLKGYALARRGTAAVYVGPVIAQDEATSVTLLDGMLGQLEGKKIYLDFHAGCETTSDALRALGLVRQRKLIRMRYGRGSEAVTSPLVLAIAGPEIG